MNESTYAIDGIDFKRIDIVDTTPPVLSSCAYAIPYLMKADKIIGFEIYAKGNDGLPIDITENARIDCETNRLYIYIKKTNLI